MATNTTTRKSTATKTSTKSAPAKPKAQPAKAAKSTPAKTAKPEAKDWSYLLEKAPSELHETFATWIAAELGIEMDAKAVQVVLAMHPTFQRSERNKSRSTYKPLGSDIVQARSVHMTAAHEEVRKARKAQEDAAAKRAEERKAKRAAARAAKQEAAKQA